MSQLILVLVCTSIILNGLGILLLTLTVLGQKDSVSVKRRIDREQKRLLKNFPVDN